jgi:hypothetical protein
MKFTEYDHWFLEQAEGFIWDASCEHIGPYVTPTVTPDRPPWKAEWTVLFGDGFYFRVVENWYRRSANLGGRGVRKAFSFHYGPTNPVRDDEGTPLYSDDYQAIIRIDLDTDGRSAHLHYDGDDHIPQMRVQNLRISEVDPFRFIRAVVEHRSNHQSFDKIMGFTVIR